ncbi:MAG: dihydrolipoyl dehydrogenase [Duncaniella sp.]|uniref:dihydrolipoyl dehydrogenase n=1 Tax=Duncaniella sp. TaxID=2518496 RepID=UPI0023CE1EC1|nr:dihydrolipoyl dehydrogenase [Duncaniella sp.]MDE5988169.1 dihydrolipoyl dehydrogenase [Duncaniella sp.]
MERFDLIVIGAGPGGYEAAAEAAALGRKVAVIERDELGGTCLNRGCIPTKALCRSAEVALTIGNSAEFGISSGEPVIDLPQIMARKEQILAGLRESVGMVLKDVTIIRGEAKFITASIVDVNGESYTAPEIFIATGSRPAALDIPGKELAMSSDEILSIQTLPNSLIIIGGGVIGMEFASIFSAFGVKVTVLEYCKEILPPFDAEIAKRLRTALKRRGIEIVTAAQVTAIEPGMIVSYDVKGKTKTAEADQVLMAVGRKAVLPEGLAELGVRIERGAIAVDDNMKVLFDGSDPSDVTLYAIGDVNGRCMLAHAAYMHGLVALGKVRLTDIIPAAVFTQPECAMVGLTEEKCNAEGREIKVGKAMFRANGKALAMGEPDGLVKIIADAKTDELLGCHICGAHAADLVQEVATAMTAGLKASAISDAVHAHPTLTEVVKAAVPK